MKKKILIVVGTRPNFIKVTQFPAAIKASGKLECKVVHTGQHFDHSMSSAFFNQFNMQPDIFLDIKTDSPVSGIAAIMTGLEKVVKEYQPDLMIVPGDVNSTLAAALTANKMNIPLAHLEAGLRSFDKTMPEEFNRILTDEMSDYFFVTERSGLDHLIKEGHNKENLYFVGNTMIDTLVAFGDKIDTCSILADYKLEPRKFILMTMHRPVNVDTKEGLTKLVDLITAISEKTKIVFPMHPRTLKNIQAHGLHTSISKNKNLVISGPLDYFAFQKLVKECLLVVTDSGGIQEETTYLHVPCLTLRANTERPVTVSLGTNELIQFDRKVVEERISAVQKGTFKKGKTPPQWDGKATNRIVNILAEKL